VKGRFLIYKFDPRKNVKPLPVEYTLTIDPKETVLMALIQIRETLDPDLAFRYACGARKCGECGMLINKKAVLACDEQVRTDQTVKPLPFFPVIKDLVVDTESFIKKTFRTIFDEALELKTTDGIVPIDLNILKTYLEPTRCMGCLLCQATCPLLRKTEIGFVGPYPLLALSQIALDPRWEGAFEPLITRMDIHACTECGMCAKICPQGIDLPAFFRLLDKRRDT
jgi:succinate dehydrogenase/fumarate reductase iron-sulfur protein